MADLRKDPVTGRWVIISTERQKRPDDFHIDTVTVKGDALCPFCQGHEDKTPPEILAYRNGNGWDVRSCRTSFLPCASKASSIAKARGCSIA
jgi:UDPglucose--hexose-1-phosphate uridylyltransferase